MYNFASLIIDRMEERKLSRTAQVVSKTMYEAMRLLAASGGPMTVTKLREQIAQKLEFTEWEQQSPSTKTQQSRWAINMTYYVFDYIKAGFLAKDRGLWYLTEEGQKMLDRTSEEVFAAAHTASRIKLRDTAQYESIDEDMKEITEETPQMILEDARSQAMDGLRQRITTMDWQDFQKLIAALLRAMGYYVPFVAPQGPDGGIDVSVVVPVDLVKAKPGDERVRQGIDHLEIHGLCAKLTTGSSNSRPAYKRRGRCMGRMYFS